MAASQVSLHAPIIPLHSHFIYRPFTQGLISLIERLRMLIWARFNENSIVGTTNTRRTSELCLFGPLPSHGAPQGPPTLWLPRWTGTLLNLQFVCKTIRACLISTMARRLLWNAKTTLGFKAHTHHECVLANGVGSRQFYLWMPRVCVCTHAVEMASSLSELLPGIHMLGPVTRSKAGCRIDGVKHWKRIAVESDPGLFPHTDPQVIRLCFVNKGLASQPLVSFRLVWW